MANTKRQDVPIPQEDAELLVRLQSGWMPSPLTLGSVKRIVRGNEEVATNCGRPSIQNGAFVFRWWEATEIKNKFRRWMDEGVELSVESVVVDSSTARF